MARLNRMEGQVRFLLPLRGVSAIDAEGLRVLGQEWKANLIRWQLIRYGSPGQISSLGDFDAWLEGELWTARFFVCMVSG